MSWWSLYQRILLHKYASASKTMKKPMESWPAAFTCFVSIASKKEKDIIKSIQYFCELHTAVKKERDQALMRMTNPHWLKSHGDEQELGKDAEIPEDIYSEEGLAALLALQVPLHGKLCGHYTVECAKHTKIFMGDLSKWDVNLISPSALIATRDDLVHLIG